MTDSKEEILRSVAVQNAQSVLLARQRAEEELIRVNGAFQEQSEWLQVTLSSIGDAVVTTDPAGSVLFLNRAAEHLTGWTQHEAKGRPLDEVFCIINGETRQKVENPAAVALREGRVVGLANHTILIAKDGTELPIDDSAAPIRDGQGRVLGVVLVFRDIVERKRAEDALRRSERELAEFFENATVGLHWVSGGAREPRGGRRPDRLGAGRRSMSFNSRPAFLQRVWPKAPESSAGQLA